MEKKRLLWPIRLLIIFLIGSLLFFYVKTNAMDAKQLYEQASNFMVKEQYTQAASLLEKAIKIKANYGAAYNALGVCYDKMGLYDQSIFAHKKYIELRPNSWVGYVSLGSTYADKGLNEQAISLYKKAIKLNPNAADAYYSLGYCYNEMGQYEEAKNYLQKSITLYQQQNYEEGASIAEEVIASMPLQKREGRGTAE